MDAFPGNSNSAKEPPPKEVVTEKKIEKIVTGRVVQRKKPLGKRILETFFGSENSVWQYLLHDVLIPAAKDTVADFVSQGIERAVYGESRSASRRTGVRPSGTSGYVSYNRFAHPAQQRPESRQISRRARASHDFGEIVLATRTEGEQVIDGMMLLLTKYDQVTVSDLYDLVGIQSSFTDEKWGWTDLRGAGLTRVTGGYLLELPHTEQLN